MILTVDAGTSVTKVAVWDASGLAAMAAVPLETRHPAPGRAEQDPADWWETVVRGCADLDRQVRLSAVEVVGCTGARQTFAPVAATGRPTGPGIVWSDRRAAVEAHQLVLRTPSGPVGSPPTGIVLDAASVAAKVAWLATHQAQALAAAAWLLTPRDFVVWHLTGEAVTDTSMASRSGLYDVEGRVVEELVGGSGARLPPVLASDTVAGPLRPEAAAATGLVPGIPVVVGAGDRACEVLGAGASVTRPMVSWGTTANVSIPVDSRPTPPPGIVVSRAADAGWLLEGGLSAAGSLLVWLSGVTGRRPEDLAVAAGASPPGARGVVATPWLEGARAPWWRPEAAAALVGVGPAHSVADLARALFESVAWDVVRCLESMAAGRPNGTAPDELVLAGSGARNPVWLEVLTGVTGLPATRRRSGQAASCGAAQLAARGAGLDWNGELADPVVERWAPGPDLVTTYRGLRARAEAVAAAVVGLDGSPGGEGPCD